MKANKIIEYGIRESQGTSAYDNNRNRMYNGQPHTINGTRGSQEVKGLTMRDIKDCFIKACLFSSVDQPKLYDKANTNNWLEDDVYKVDFSKIDPIAIAQNMGCEMEKMMNIFPNLKLRKDERHI